MSEVVSPLSPQPPRRVRELAPELIIASLRDYFGQEPPAGVCETAYTMWECTETGLQFAEPRRQGSAEFYRWIGGFETYYPGLRWEYGRVREIVAQSPPISGPILDVGAGKGDFLAAFDLVPPAMRFGLDLNEDAVRHCRERGFRAHCGTVSDAIAAGFVEPGSCPVVTAFHVLEHVEDPVGFVSSLVSLAGPSGRVFLSTPNSPMSFENTWFDILNHPPHHLTRWNPKAYAALAGMLGCRLRVFHPPSSFLRDTFKLFHLLTHGPKPVPRRQLIREAMGHPLTLARCLAAQMAYHRTHEPPHADLILVELQPR